MEIQNLEFVKARRIENKYPHPIYEIRMMDTKGKEYVVEIAEYIFKLPADTTGL